MNKTLPFAMQHAFIPGNSPHKENNSLPGYLFLFFEDKILVVSEQDTLKVPLISINKLPKDVIKYRRFIGTYCTTPCYVIELHTSDLHIESFIQTNLRDLFGTISDDLFSLAGKSRQILSWHLENMFCGKCGTAMIENTNELAKQCTACHHIAYPRISPVVIMTIERDNEILLGRSAHFPKGMYSPLAGFVEAGETLEEAVMREVAEEASIKVSGIRYVTNQPWPFPHSLMIGFRTKYESGDIIIDTNELEDARWFHVDDLPALPSQISISRYLIELFIKSCGKTPKITRSTA